MAFSRGLYTGWFRGINNQELVHARFGKKRGVFLGDVTRVSRDRVMLSLNAPLKAGDGIVFDRGHPDEKEEGGRVFTVQAFGSHDHVESVVVTFPPGAVDFSRIRTGDKVWKTSDPALDRRLRQTFAEKVPQFQRPLRLEVHGHVGAPLTVIARDGSGSVVQATSSIPLAEAKTQPLTADRLRDQLGRLGGSAFKLGDLRNEVQGKVMLPLSELNRLRRELVAQLELLRAKPRRWILTDYTLATPFPSQTVRKASEPELIVLVRSLPQLDAALACDVRTVYCDFEDPKKYREAVTTLRCAPGCDSPERTIWVAPPRITKPNEDWILNQIRSCGADGYLIRNYDHLKFFSDSRRRGDFSLNVANPLTGGYFVERYGLERVTASYDLNFEQLSALLESGSPERFEITIHQHMPMFHMEHCVFCAFLSKGTDYRNCGRPCDKHEVRLRDRVGAEHPLKADAGCRNTLFNARAQTGAEYVSRLLDLGAKAFRLEFLTETPDELAQTVALYQQLLRGKVSGSELWRQLKLQNQLGVTRGQMVSSERWE
jgi:putative protease